MSFRNVQENNIPSKTLIGATYLGDEWVRNPSWLPLASIDDTQQKFTGLYRINRFANFIAVIFNTSGGAQYTIDWGDGSAPVNVNSGTQANYEYDYNDVDLAGTDAPVTFTASTNTVDRTAHGYIDGMTINFATIVTTTGILVTENYYVINATTNTFQLSTQEGGSPVTLTNDGSGTILPFKQVVITVTPVSGNLTVCNLYVKHNQAGLQNGYVTGWLDAALSGNYTTVSIGNTGTVVRNSGIQRIQLLKSSLTSFANLFFNCHSLASVPILSSTASVTNVSGLFSNCYALQIIPPLPVTVSNTSSLFLNCFNIKSTPIFNTASVTTMDSMFSGCRNLTSVPLFNTANVTNMNSMFANCSSLKAVPRFNTSNVTSMGSLFSGCSSLTEIPQYDTAKVTNMGGMFASCASLIILPLLNTANVTAMNSMFSGVSSLTTIPAFNTIKVTNMDFFTNSNPTIRILPYLNTSNVTAMNEAFRNCTSLQYVANWDTQKVTNLKDGFGSCVNLQYLGFTDLRSCTNFNIGLQSCASLQEVNFDLRSLGNFSDFGSLLSNLFSCSRMKLPNAAGPGISPTNCKLSGEALNELYTSLAPCGGACTFQGVADTVTKAAHGYSEGQPIRFSTITTTTGIAINVRYFIRNPTTDTFQLSTTISGSIINLVNDGTGVITAYTITVSGNYGTTSDDPTIATNKGWTVTGS